MSDPFNILGKEFDAPPSFEQAAREAVEKLRDTAERFGRAFERIPEEAYSDEEWLVVERAAHEALEAIERAEEGYVAVMYDSHAWYRILENLEQIRLRLESAVGLMDLVEQRTSGT
jgi:hypothetical protein